MALFSFWAVHLESAHTCKTVGFAPVLGGQCVVAVTG